MQVKLWGTRGSVAAPGPETMRYGGNTSCVTVRGDNGTLLILDAGTGIRRLTATIPVSVRRIYLLLTQLHLDHIQGLGFFGILRRSQNEVHLWGPAGTTLSLRERLSRYFSPPLFPVYMRDLTAPLHLHEINDAQFEIGEFKITAKSVVHMDPTVGYRIECGGKTVTYLPDHEPALGNPDFSADPNWTSGYSLAQGADLLIHDAQYTAEEYPYCVGFGHSAIPHTFQFAEMVKAKHLVPFHHDPTHSDDLLDRIYARYLKELEPDYNVTPGKEGMVFDVG